MAFDAVEVVGDGLRLDAELRVECGAEAALQPEGERGLARSGEQAGCARGDRADAAAACPGEHDNPHRKWQR